MKKKTIMIIPIIALSCIMLTGCSLKEMIEKDKETFNNEDPYKTSNENVELPEKEKKEYPSTYTSENFKVNALHSEYAIAQQDGSDFTLEVPIEKDGYKNVYKVNYETYEGNVEYEVNDFDELTDLGNSYYGKKDGATYVAYFKCNNKLFVKMYISGVSSTEIATNKNDVAPIVNEDTFKDDAFLDAIKVEYTKREDSTIVTDADYVVVIEPETYSEVNYSEEEQKMIYTIVYDDNITINLLTKLNQCGIYNISNVVLKPSQSGYLFEIHSENGVYLAHENNDFHVDYIQKDDENGEYIYKEELR